MPSIFTRILENELPASFVHRDEVVAGFLDIQPLTPGHTLVVPVREVAGSPICRRDPHAGHRAGTGDRQGDPAAIPR